ncbi:MAG: hypothetical protein QXM43_00485 [Desulfurococcaceae archaeon]
MLTDLKERLGKERSEVGAKRGGRMMELRIAFFTDGIASEKGKVVPRVCWDIGTVRLLANESRGLKPSEPYFFNGLSELLPTIERLLAENEVKVLHYLGRTKSLHY